MKKKLLALAIGGVLSAGVQAGMNDIIITEYIESTSYDSNAIELTNTGTSDYTFTDEDTLEYSSYSNQVLNPDGKNIFTGQSIAAGETLVIYDGKMDAAKIAQIKGAKVAATSFKLLPDHQYNHLGFSGDDQVLLKRGINVVDVIGVNGSKWGENKSFIRRTTSDGLTPSGDTIRYIEENWQETAANTYSDLGTATYGSNAVEPAAPEIFKMTAEDEGSFQAALARYAALGSEVIINADLNDDEAGDQGLVITRSFGFNVNGYTNNMSASYKRANVQPNQEFVAGTSFAGKQQLDNVSNTLIIDSVFPAEDGTIAYYPTFHTDAANNAIRINDKIKTIQGIIVESEFGYKLLVTKEVDSSNFDRTERPAKPTLSTTVEDGHFAIKIATQNVLNLFNSPFGGADNLHGGSRGANTESEYQHQKAKLVEAVYGLNADIVGLMEIENNGFSDTGTIAEFVEAINAKYYNPRPEDKNDPESSINKYAFIGFDSNGDSVLDELDSIGSDVITSGIIYRPSKVSIKSTKIIPMPQQHAPVTRDYNGNAVVDQKGMLLENGDNYQRDTVTATFVINQTGKRVTVAVNHFKSKGSTCHEDWEGVDFGADQFNDKGQYTNAQGNDDAPDLDFQGQCENFRVAAAVQLGTELEKIGGDRVVIGDMNSYAKEDPILVLTENTTKKVIKTARDTFIGKTPQFSNSGDPVIVENTYGYISAVGKKDEERGDVSWSYAYDDSIGSLDHILITPSLESRLIDATDWHINAAESVYYDYSTYRSDETKGLVYSKGPNGSVNFVVDDSYRSSDHDPAIMSLSYKYGEVSDGQPVHLVIENGIASIPYVMTKPTLVKTGDIAEISLSSEVDMSEVSLPNAVITQDGQSVVAIEVYGMKAGAYNATMTLVRDGKLMPELTQSMAIEVGKTDSLTPKVTVTENDGTGGSFGIFGILSLLGLGFLRRTKA
ncbi:MAG: ExeM/NucH family extracellular endonuclease [Moritella sp.]|uniref:ExeM/NucH family extracellular endonuclease n=1 Tax=Moritella sp. TaxID=78556 RepID=UPI0029B6E24F|nr:ExeM/NucH family extracellular endonuclease [Moritella sp.]MDX2319234.1 ExeM/NucH family extracellular endonuclease [Moritella sp.]